MTNQSVLQDWVLTIPLRKQGTLVAAIRGCDGIPKQDISKQFSRALRRDILNPADPDWKVNEPGGFFDAPHPNAEEIKNFATHLDHYPLHWVTHFYLAAEVVMHHHDNLETRLFWYEVYHTIIHALHLRPESIEDFNQRLCDGLRPERFR